MVILRTKVEVQFLAIFGIVL